MGRSIRYVSHDEDDGARQIHSAAQPASAEASARVVSLRSIVGLDPTIADIADLPLGWHAWRETQDGDWHRQRKKLI
jgi:hypothetical protein